MNPTCLHPRRINELYKDGDHDLQKPKNKAVTYKPCTHRLDMHVASLTLALVQSYLSFQAKIKQVCSGRGRK